jgi:hypothetical protein
MPELKFIHITTKGMVFDPQTGDSFQINETAKIILELMQDGNSQDEVIKKITKIYAISFEEALTDFLEFKLQLRVLGMLP